MEIGNIIRNKRIDLRLSQKELAEKIDCSPSQLCKWEKGELKVSIENVVKIEKVLGVGILTKEFMEKAGGN